MEWITIGSLLLVIVFMGWLVFHVQKVHELREKDLLDRIMAKDYNTFVNAEVVRETAKRPDQIYEDQQERGIVI
jgi:FtsH-binding integral membrane protein